MSLIPDLPTFVASAMTATRIPVCREVPLEGRTPLDIVAAVRTRSRPLLLESGKGGRYSYVAIASDVIWTSRGRQCTITIEGAESKRIEGDPFDLLRDLFAGESTVAHPLLKNFTGGAIGYLAYDIARQIERLPDIANDDLGLPDSYFVFVDSFFEIDHTDEMIRVVAAPRLDSRRAEEQYAEIARTIDSLAALLDAPSPLDSTTGPVAIQGDATDPLPIGQNVSRERFCDMVERARDYIIAGDIFQVNLSIRFALPFAGDPLALYRELRRINPSPYMSYLELPGLAIASASPEQLLRVHGRTVETRPIAGTRPRGADELEDLRNADELIGNEKERAEHLMLVDLERNDIGRVARYGSVEVSELMAIERYSHVIHIVSNVRGELAEGRDTFDAIRACFPGGTITGAPKVRSMEIIEELEPTRRGIYTGSIGWIGYDGSAELNIAIRTIVVSEGIAYAQAGAGIVYDSVPEHEYRESRRKAQAAIEAVRSVCG